MYNHIVNQNTPEKQAISISLPKDCNKNACDITVTLPWESLETAAVFIEDIFRLAKLKREERKQKEKKEQEFEIYCRRRNDHSRRLNRAFRKARTIVRKQGVPLEAITPQIAFEYDINEKSFRNWYKDNENNMMKRYRRMRNKIILKMVKEKFKQKEIAERFGITSASVSNVVCTHRRENEIVRLSKDGVPLVRISRDFNKPEWVVLNILYRNKMGK